MDGAVDKLEQLLDRPPDRQVDDKVRVGLCWMSVALPLSLCRRHAKPAERSANALIVSSALMTSAITGCPSAQQRGRHSAAQCASPLSRLASPRCNDRKTPAEDSMSPTDAIC